jgi:hypothetical protein
VNATLARGVAALAVAALAACAGDGPSSVSSQASGTRIVLDTDAAGVAWDRLLLGTNVPAWLGPDRLADEGFRQAIADAGITWLRFPGGSWSNGYDWLGCERRDESACFWTWAARPSDFLDLAAGTGLPAMWTVSANATAQEAAALVAFANGEVDDDRIIGRDRRDRDWGTVGEWAALRAEHGRPEPVRIELWEFGNEVFGGRPDAGPECASFGWEDVWTCDGSEYVTGSDEHDGYLAVRAAMLAVDPDIAVGAVGVPDAGSWGGWGAEVASEAGDAIDFYVVHHYGFDSSPPPDDVLDAPRSQWPSVMAGVLDTFEADPGVAAPPVAVTEYNLVAFQDADTEAVMATQANALYLAATLGEMAAAGVDLAAQWNLANGEAPNGTDYGLLDADTGERHPAYEAFRMWSQMGDTLVPIEVRGDPALRAFGARRDDGSLTVLVLNGADTGASFDLDLVGSDGAWSLTESRAVASSLAARTNTPDTVGRALGEVGSRFAHEIPAASMSLLHLAPVNATASG